MRSRTTAQSLLALAFAAGATTPAAAAQPQALGPAASAAPELTITFEEAAVAAEELTASGDAVFFSVAREPQGFYTRVARRRSVEIVDPFGEARFEPESGDVALKSVWTVVDLKTGAFGIAAPPGFGLRRVPFPNPAFEVGAPGLVNRLRHGFGFVAMLLVRPGMGAWELQAADAGPRDVDGADDERPTTALGDMRPLGASPGPPGKFASGDVLVVIDPRRLGFYATRLIGPPATRGVETGGAR